MTPHSLVVRHKHPLNRHFSCLVPTRQLLCWQKEKGGPKSDPNLPFQIPLVGFHFNFQFLSLNVNKVHKTNTFHSQEGISPIFFPVLLGALNFCSQSAFLERHRLIYRFELLVIDSLIQQICIEILCSVPYSKIRKSQCSPGSEEPCSIVRKIDMEKIVMRPCCCVLIDTSNNSKLICWNTISNLIYNCLRELEVSQNM